MWLLSTDRAELHYFSRNFDAIDGYAILSHTWDEKEQTLQEVQAIIEQCHIDSRTPRDCVHPKIRNCCIIAEKHGYRWVWIDSCCIDKTSSSELSESINSMFRWYKEAEVCFAYLADVPSYCVLHARHSAFRKSRWHTRGWTLQELIAPDFLIFLSTDWHELGNRADLAGLLQQITGVPSGILTGEAQPGHFSVCVRMSWASKRNTTRVEDEAYCLMGLFGVSLPTNYGEGKKAFIRLQYEIMQHDPDMSLFAFGGYVPLDHSVTFYPEQNPNNSWRYLMAASPREFNRGFSYIPNLGKNAKQEYPPPLDSDTTGPFEGGVELPRVSVTSYGVKLRVPIHEAYGLTIAVILCQRNGKHYGLFLKRDSGGKDPTRPLYFTGCVSSKPGTSSARYIARLADLGDDLDNLTFKGKPVKASWRTIYVVPTASDLESASSTTPNLIMNCNPASHFRIPRWLIAQFTAAQFEVTQLRNGKMIQVVKFFDRIDTEIYLSFGSCPEHCNLDHDVLWIKLDMLHSTEAFIHNCSEDHIDSESWAVGSRDFGDTGREVRLSLQVRPSAALTKISNSKFEIHLELLGHIFEERFSQLRSLPMFPPLADVKTDTLRPAPNSNHAISSRPPSWFPTYPSPSQKSSSGSLTTMHRSFRSVLRLVRNRGPDSQINVLESELRALTLDVDVDGPVPGGAAVAETCGQVEHKDSDG